MPLALEGRTASSFLVLRIKFVMLTEWFGASPVDVGVQQFGCVLRKLRKMDHFGLQLCTVAFVNPSVLKSAQITKKNMFNISFREKHTNLSF